MPIDLRSLALRGSKTRDPEPRAFRSAAWPRVEVIPCRLELCRGPTEPRVDGPRDWVNITFRPPLPWSLLLHVPVHFPELGQTFVLQVGSHCERR
ncbi:hypothetical protein BaRGS_00016059 [Batillaria attramentaria]|uniref:Uncharacterized protein n=1 Tax=Batillaria attramentaria TaxID=370345 RepID=A0ABD0L003_9CAEN